jgi:hypothetical protein
MKENMSERDAFVGLMADGGDAADERFPGCSSDGGDDGGETGDQDSRWMAEFGIGPFAADARTSHQPPATSHGHQR